MSTWTSKAALTAIALLAACEGYEPATRAAPSRVLVPGNVIVTGPAGYCIDQGATRLGEGEAFVLLGSCAAITRDGAQPTPQAPAIIAVSVRSGLDVSLDDLASLFTPGSIPGDGSESVLSAERDNAVLFVKSDDGAGATWRALLPLDGNLISARVLSPPREPVSPESERAALGALARALRSANAG